MTGASILAATGITLMLAFASPVEPGFFYYDKGLLLAISFTYTLLRLQFVPTTLAALVVLLGYEAVAVLVHGMASPRADDTLTAAFVGNNFFLVSTILVAMFAAYWLEAYARASFLQRREIEREKTALVDAMEQLTATQSQLVQSERMALLGSLVAGITHELSTPVAAIESSAATAARALEKMGFAERTTLAEMPVQVLHDCHRMLRVAARRIRGLLDNLKRFSRLDRAHYGTVDVHEALDVTLAVLSAELGDRIAVVRGYGEVPRFQGYPRDVNQIFMNLFLNAIQAIPDRGTIRLSTSVEDGLVCVRISDDGVGMSEAQLARLFVPTFSSGGERVKASLGLFVCHRVVERHGGRIDVESIEGGGTTVVVKFPTRAPTDAGRHERAERPKEPALRG
jgi:signal transduction histidine kinase